MKLSV
ncbi:hypothetical protein VCBJG01_0078, partial [Vibrio cholerae BJG-01]